LYDESVALNVVIYHGLLLYYNEPLTLGEKDYWDQILYNLAIGALPRDELRGSSPQFDGLRALEYRVFCEHLNWLQFESIERLDHRDNVWRTLYADGTEVLVNFGREPASWDGADVPARSFRVTPGTPGHEPLAMEENTDLTRQPPALAPDGHYVSGPPLRGAADVAARIGELTGGARLAANPVTG
jgi:hypothetical protein